ncbi:MAG TPA: PilZ domain-containing protein [Thermoanaerobaculia bacterium]
MPFSKRRRVHRIRLATPILGRLGGQSVVIVDVSLDGAKIEHNEALKTGAEARLAFDWDHGRISLRARVTRCKLERFAGSGGEGLTVFHSGLIFTDPDAERDTLKRMIATEISRALEEQKANARGELPVSVERMPIFRDHTFAGSPGQAAAAIGERDQRPVARIARQTGYICCRLDHSSWKTTRTNSPEQPDNGFTVSASEDLEQIEHLCEAYRKGDEAAREFIRTLARLSVSEAVKP